MKMGTKPNVYLTSNVFEQIAVNEKISQDIRDKIKKLWDHLNSISNLKVFDGRFPDKKVIAEVIEKFQPKILGCHLSHPITNDLLKNSNIISITTSTAGYNHIQRTEKDDILITHTPGVLHETVADYTIALIMSCLRNVIDLHEYVWEGKWIPEHKWDLDQSLSSVIDNKVLGILGMGEIGAELLKRLYPWGMKILYYDIKRREDLEGLCPNIIFKENLGDIFKEADILSIHIPLNIYTEKIINRDLLKLMKKNALLINTARGPILDLEALLDLLEKKEININIALDVFPIEPVDQQTLQRLKKIKREQPEIRMILMPHNASADADTRGKMNIIFLEDIIKIIESKSLEDLKEVRIIPEHRAKLNECDWKIYQYWKQR